MTFRQMSTIDALEKNAFGIMQPLGKCPIVMPTHIIVPGLAFDGSGHRLGYGRGYYDTFLSQTNTHKRKTVGVAFAGQKMEHFEPQAHDVPLDDVYYF